MYCTVQYRTGIIFTRSCAQFKFELQLHLPELVVAQAHVLCSALAGAQLTCGGKLLVLVHRESLTIECTRCRMATGYPAGGSLRDTEGLMAATHQYHNTPTCVQIHLLEFE